MFNIDSTKLILSSYLVFLVVTICLNVYVAEVKKEQQDKQLQIVMEIEKSNIQIMEEINDNFTDIKNSIEQIHWSIENERK